MSSFNTLERSLARFLSRYPLFKSVTKASYTRLIYFKSRKPYSYQSNYRVQSLTTDNLISFFGYYDKSPVNKAGLILVCATDGDSRRAPSVCQPVSLLV